jgi:hypothetical protein
MIPWARGKCLTWDVTVPDTFAASHIDRTSQCAGAAAFKAAEFKSTKYAELTSYIFVPIAVETTGVWNDVAFGFVKDLGKRFSSITDNGNDNRETSWLFQRLSVAVQRGNELCFTNSLRIIDAAAD